MIVIVDTNILFSAIISPNNTIANLIANPNLLLQKVTCNFAIIELFKYQSKLVKASKKDLEEVLQNYYTVLRNIDIYNETHISKEHWHQADFLTSGVDKRILPMLHLHCN